MHKLFLTCCLTLLLNPLAKAQYYSYSVLPNQDANTALTPYGINNKGDVVGTAITPLYYPAAFRTSGGTTTFLPSPYANSQSEGLGINSAGTIVGYASDSSNVHAVYASPGGGYVDMDSADSQDSEAVAINDNNWVVGSLEDQPFLGYTSGWKLPLGSTLGGSFEPTGLNNQLQLVGNGVQGGEIYNALSGELTILKNCLGTIHNTAQAINNLGVVAGTVGTQGYLYSAGTVTYFGAGISEVKGMNASGDVIGNLTSGHSFVYLHSNGHFIDLNMTIASSISGVWTIIDVGGINDSGVICGAAIRPAKPGESIWGSNVYQAFKLTPLVIVHPPIIIPEQH